MLKRCSTLLRPNSPHKSLSFKRLLPYSGYNPYPNSDESWRQFPYIPFFSANTKLGLFLGLPALTGYLIPHDGLFDAVAVAAALATVPLDAKFFKKDPHTPPLKIYGRELSSKLVSQSAYAVSCLLSFGLLGENYLISSMFMIGGYFLFMGAYRLATGFLPPESLTKSKIVMLGSLLSSAGLYLVTDLSDIVDGPIIDLAKIMFPIYVAYSSLIGTKIVDIYSDASKAMADDPINPANLEGEGDKMQGILNQMEDNWKMEHHTTKLLILYKWANIGAYIILLTIIAIAKYYGLKAAGPPPPENNQQRRKEEH